MVSDPCQTEWVFFLEDFDSLHVPSSFQAGLYDFLSRQLNRTPRLLSLHVCRITAATQYHQEAVYGALVDLAFVLGEKGRPLRDRMVSGSRRWVAANRFETLQGYLQGQITLADMPFSPCSLFQEGLWGSIGPLVDTDQSDSATPTADSMAVAKACLEAGQVEQARELLEQILIQQPGSNQVRQELLEIYRATGDRERFLHSYHYCQSQGISDPCWEDSVKWFETEER